MRTTVRSEAEAVQVSARTLLKPGWYDGRIEVAIEKPSARGNDMIELGMQVADTMGNVRTIRDWLTNTERSAAKLRHACEAVGALPRYESGEIGQADFPGHDVQVKISVEKRRGYPDQNRIDDYRPAAGHVINLRTA